MVTGNAVGTERLGSVAASGAGPRERGVRWRESAGKREPPRGLLSAVGVNWRVQLARCGWKGSPNVTVYELFSKMRARDFGVNAFC